MGGYFALRGAGGGALPAGVVTGASFGLVMALFAEAQRRRLQVTGDLDGEAVLHQGPANHWRRGESRGGWLVLTKARLMFRAHGKNVQNAPLVLPLPSVRAAEATRSFGIVPNGLRVHLASGEHESFVVSGRSEWVVEITHALEKLA